MIHLSGLFYSAKALLDAVSKVVDMVATLEGKIPLQFCKVVFAQFASFALLSRRALAWCITSVVVERMARTGSGHRRADEGRI
jgi:hypothetical protein